ncbi:uncharacterized protein [Diadema antillarum]|uniref:uncharacterized protein isoform X1 n=2 Tax=Diadema antillarum TaxID=105358 RepID=UPI003A88329E
MFPVSFTVKPTTTTTSGEVDGLSLGRNDNSEMGRYRQKIALLFSIACFVMLCQIFLALFHSDKIERSLLDVADSQSGNRGGDEVRENFHGNSSNTAHRYRYRTDSGLSHNRKNMADDHGSHQAADSGKDNDDAKTKDRIPREEQDVVQNISKKEHKDIQDHHMRQPSQHTQDRPQNSKPDPAVKYVLPLLLGNQGMNNQMQAFKLICIIALKRNLTVVLPPFFDHSPSPETQMLRTFDESYDAKSLSEMVPVVSLQEFKRKCNNKVDASFLGTNMVENQTEADSQRINEFVERTLKVFTNHTGVHVPSVLDNLNNSDVIIQIADDLPYLVAVDDFLDMYPHSLVTKKQCNAFLYGYGYLGRLRYMDHIMRYAQYFVKSRNVQTMTYTIVQQGMMANQPYLCIHWRYNDEWSKSWCKHDYVQYICKVLAQISPTALAKNITNFATQRHLEAVYFASELYENTTLISGLRRNLGLTKFFTSADLFHAGARFLKDDNFLTSLVEQEICKRSAFFLASSFSSWSDMVIEDRLGRDYDMIAGALFGVEAIG